MKYVFKGQENLDQSVMHFLTQVGNQFQVLCMPAKGQTRVRNCSRTKNATNWEEVSCPVCLKLKTTA